jgi:hypothetical protein
MSRYRIDPSGVQGVLTSTQTEAEEFQTVLTPLQGEVEKALTASGNSGAIGGALSSFFDNQSTLLTAIQRRVGAGLTGAFNATKAYCDGDLEMVDTYMKNAATAANPPAVDVRRYGGMEAY